MRNVLGEFEGYAISNQRPYASWAQDDFKLPQVAIVGAREYIFLENNSILGDVAAGKEQAFGTLTARTLSWMVAAVASSAWSPITAVKVVMDGSVCAM